MKKNKQPKFEVYCYSCKCALCNGRDVYVGKAKYGAAQRHKGHLIVAKAILNGRNNPRWLKFDYFLAKHGLENVCYRIVAQCFSEDEMNFEEVKLIQELRTFSTFGGLNFDLGGTGGRPKGVWKPSAEHLKRWLTAARQRIMSDAEKLVISQRMTEYWKNIAVDERLRRKFKTRKTIQQKLQENAEYAENMKVNQQIRSMKGNAALAQKMCDFDFREKYRDSLSKGVKNWCENNPDACKDRAKKAAVTRQENQNWLQSHRKVAEQTSLEEYQRRAKKSWETRRKNSQEKQ